MLELVLVNKPRPSESWPSQARARIESLVGTTFGQVNESAVYGIRGGSSRGLRRPPREFPLYIECRIPLSAVKHAQLLRNLGLRQLAIAT